MAVFSTNTLCNLRNNVISRQCIMVPDGWAYCVLDRFLVFIGMEMRLENFICNSCQALEVCGPS
jgi:hypothetical protein